MHMHHQYKYIYMCSIHDLSCRKHNESHCCEFLLWKSYEQAAISPDPVITRPGTAQRIMPETFRDHAF